jgi:hypothetical protein
VYVRDRRKPLLAELLKERDAVQSTLALAHVRAVLVAGGRRKRLFADDAALTRFELVKAKPTSSGALIATYRSIR